MLTVAKNISTFRKQKSISIKTMMDELNLCRNTYKNLEEGKRDIKFNELLKISSMFGVSLIALLPDEIIEKDLSDLKNSRFVDYIKLNQPNELLINLAKEI